MAEELSKCLELYKVRHQLFKRMDLKIVAVHHDQSWYNIRTIILLLAQGTSIMTKRMVNLEDFVIIHERLNSDEFVRLLQDINADNLEIDGLKINLAADPIPPLRLHDYCRGDSLRAKERWNIEWPVDWYEWAQSHKLHNELIAIFNEINMKLRCFDPPYRDVEEAVIDLLKLPKYHFQENSRDSRCSILLPNFVAIEHARLEGNRFEIAARFHESMDIEDLVLSVIGYGRKTSRFRENLEGGEIETSPPFVRVTKSFKINDVADIQLYLFSKKMEKYGHYDQRLARNVKSTLNPRVASHEVFDEGSVRLLERLRGEAKRDVKHSFEHSVATLLHMCGFRTEWLDYPGVAQDAPDILAFCSEPNLVIVGECTRKIPDRNKYKSLKERAESLKAQVRIDVYPTMFTSAEASSNEQDEAWKYEVALVTPEKLKELHDMVTRAKTTREILYILTRRYW